MKREKPENGDWDALPMADEFCRIIITVDVKANDILTLRIGAKWFMVQWGDRTWEETKRLKFTKNGKFDIHIIGEEITWVNIKDWGAVSIHLDGCPTLTKLRCQGNKLERLLLSDCPLIKDIDCSDNRIEYLQIANLAHLEVFKANNNRLKVIDFTGCPRLKNVEVNGNDIYALVTKDSPMIKKLWFDDSLFRLDEFTRTENNAAELIINDEDEVTVKSQNELVSRAKKVVADLRKEYKDNGF